MTITKLSQEMTATLIGGQKSGRLSLATTYANGSYSPNDEDYFSFKTRTKSLDLDGKDVKIYFNCPRGEKGPRPVARWVLKGSNGVFLCFPVSCKELFQQAKDAYEELKDVIDENMSIMVLGTMKDMEREVLYEEGKEFADSIPAPYYEVSAATGENVNEVFEMMAREILRRKPSIVKVKEEPVSEPSKCKV